MENVIEDIKNNIETDLEVTTTGTFENHCWEEPSDIELASVTCEFEDFETICDYTDEAQSLVGQEVELERDAEGFRGLDLTTTITKVFNVGGLVVVRLAPVYYEV